MQLVQLWDLLPWKKHVTKMSDCPGALAKLVLRKMHTKTSLMKLNFSARKAVHDCYQCWKFELKISWDSGDMHFSAIKPRWGGCPPLNSMKWGAFFDIFAFPLWPPLRMRTKVVSFSCFFPEDQANFEPWYSEYWNNGRGCCALIYMCSLVQWNWFSDVTGCTWVT